MIALIDVLRGTVMTTAALMVTVLLVAAWLLWRGQVQAGTRFLGAVMLGAVAAFVGLVAIERPDGWLRILYAASIGLALPLLVVRLSRSRPVIAAVRQAFEPADREMALRVAAVFAALATPLAALPLAQHWDVSGWMDSRTYDVAAHNIATGKLVAGNSAYMPLYQYGMALIYYAFGHFYFAQQVINALLAVAAVAAVTLTAWVLFETAAAMIVAGCLAVYARPLFYALHFTQIETWFTPLTCLLLLAWAVYWRATSAGAAAALAVMVGLGLNTRNQGTLLFAFLAATPLITPLPWRRRFAHALLITLVVGVTLLPWTVRNVMVEGRLSPLGSRSPMYVGILSDPRVGLYGIRYWEGWNEIAAEYESRYPDASQRESAYLHAAWVNLTQDPLWTGKALVWRAAAFYGLLPDGWIEPASLRQTDWRREWKSYLVSRATPLCLLPLSLMVLLLAGDRTLLALAGAIAAGVAIILVSATSEDRLSYPLYPMHFLITAGLLRSARTGGTAVTLWRRSRAPRAVAIVAMVLVGTLTLGRATIGAVSAYRPIMESSMRTDPDIRLDDRVPLLTSAGTLAGGLPVEIGTLVRVRCMATNHMFPPKFAGAVPDVPAFASDPNGSLFFFAYLLDSGMPPPVNGAIGVTYRNAAQSVAIREGEAVEIQGTVLHGPTAGSAMLWLAADRVVRLPIPAASLPPFP